MMGSKKRKEEKRGIRQFVVFDDGSWVM